MKLRVASDEALVEAYVQAILEESAALSTRAANRHADVIVRIARELRGRGPEARVKLVPLLTHSHPSVRLWSAGHSLDFIPDEAAFVLRRLAQEPGEIGLTVETTLELWKEGTLELP